MVGRSDTNRYLRVQQAADLLGVSATTLRRWADSGRIACERTPSDQRRFLREDLAGLVSGHNRAAAGPPPDVVDGNHYRLLYDTSLELASSLDLDHVLQSAARRLIATLGIPDCDIYRLEGDGTIVCLASMLGGASDTSWVGNASRSPTGPASARPSRRGARWWSTVAATPGSRKPNRLCCVASAKRASSHCP